MEEKDIKEVELTQEQKSLALGHFQELDLSMLTKFIFKDESKDGRSLEGKAVKKFLSEQGKPVKTTKYEKLPDVELTDDNKEFIEGYMESNNSNPIELTKILYPDRKITPNGKEFRAVYNYMKSVSPNQTDMTDERVDNREYKPPQNIQGIAGLINLYVTTGDSKRKTLNPLALRSIEEKRCKALMSYLKTPRFIYQASSYEKKIDRILFESEFVRYAYDKEDLTSEEQSQYVSLCAEIVNEQITNRLLTYFQDLVEEGMKSDDDAKRKHSQALAENVSAWRLKAEASKKQQNALLKELTQSRNDRLDEKLNANASILAFLELWINQESRDKLISIAIKEKEEDREEVNRLEDLDALMVLVAGQTKEEAGN